MIRCLVWSTLLSSILWLQPATAAAADTLVLATTGTSREAVQIIDGNVPEAKPGWFVELSRRAAERCGTTVDFAFMPWARVLEMVKLGQVSAAFNSSYKADRAEYGVYPRKDGELDEARASRNYGYYAYVSKTSTDTALLENADIKGRLVVTERQASIISLLEDRGANVVETADFLMMMRIVAGGRADAVVAIGHDMDSVLADNPDLAALIIKLEIPIQKKIGYVMFSKIFYAKNHDLVECFWTASAELRKTEWFEAMRATYQ